MEKPATYPPELGRLSDIPRATLFTGPTPLQPMPNLGAACGGRATLYVKRDDCTELAFGGNKVRQLEYYLGEAVAQDADTVLITGARKLGMACHIQLEERVATNDPTYRDSGNVLLDRLLGATLHTYPHGEDEAGADRELERIAEELTAAGKRPYIILLAPGHAPLGALGYVVTAWEMLGQIEAEGLHLDEIFVASGSGATHAGLLFGLRALGSDIRVIGVCVRRDAASQRPRIAARCREIAELLELDCKVTGDDIVITDEFLAPGYGKLGDAAGEALLMAAQSEALMLDPTYTAKVMAGLIARARSAADNANLLFMHTGGAPALFAYQTRLNEILAENS